jgi:hypothetical protein
MDARLPGGGLPLGALHEVAGGGNGAVDGATAALFAAGIVARTKGKVLWCIARPDLFAPALALGCMNLFEPRIAPEVLRMRRDERGVIDPAMSSSPVAASAFVKGRPCAQSVRPSVPGSGTLASGRFRSS